MARLGLTALACTCVACAFGAGLALGSRKQRTKAPAPVRRTGTRADGSTLPSVHHVGLVVRDRDRTLATLSDGLGFGPAFCFDGVFPDAILANGETGLALKGAFVWMHNTALEVVEPADDRSPHAEFLKEKGEGLHHLAYWVGSVRGEIAAMARGGMTPRVMIDGTAGEVPWCYLDGDVPGDALIELIERNPGSEQFYEQVFAAIGGRIPV